MAPVTGTYVPIQYDDSGSGEPALLFLPGWCAPRGVFSGLMQRCSAWCRTMTLDWRGHGGSGQPDGDFGEAELVEDAVAVITASGAEQVVPVALSHAGWVAIELRRRLGTLIPKLVFMEWMMTEATPGFRDRLAGLRSPEKWRRSVEQLFALWLARAENPELVRYVTEEMGAFGHDMWARAAREIAAAYDREGRPLLALASLEPPAPALHLYAQPDEPHYLSVQQAFAEIHPWFTVHRLAARSHFPMFEAPDQMAEVIGHFIGGRSG